MQETAQADSDSGIALLIFSVGALRFAVDSRHIQGISDLDRSRDTTAPALADLLGLAPARASAF
uniref:hypothetical protein n=1 Tax=Thiocapsa sp. TaxID=2024551 RepID=UPI003593CC9C